MPIPSSACEVTLHDKVLPAGSSLALQATRTRVTSCQPLSTAGKGGVSKATFLINKGALGLFSAFSEPGSLECGPGCLPPSRLPPINNSGGRSPVSTADGRSLTRHYGL